MTTSDTGRRNEQSDPAVQAAHLAARPQWLTLGREAVVEPDLPVIDAHHHLWDPPERRYLLDELLADTDTGHAVAATVFVECGAMYRASGPEAFRRVGEVEFATAIAVQCEKRRHGDTRACAAIVGSIDYTLGHWVEPVLEAQLAASGSRLKGVRGRTAWDASPDVNILATPAGIMTRAETRDAIACVGRLGLSVDVWSFYHQMDEAAALARAFPSVRFVINHTAGPLGVGPYYGRRDELFPAWAAKVAELASVPNVVVKLGGLAMRYAGFEFDRRPRPPSSDELVRAWRPYVETSIQAFGPDRCMFESNFPVDKSMVGYVVLWNAFKKLCAGYGKEERRFLLSGTAAQVYGIAAG
ncbi:amidohydrolase family protein [Aquamicrobium sp. LC103]|uniref:amidohydrolase family protein n=1 Tax=Aquamicrobium sp. LC103 TaxID=1120658 RepID=UPI00063E87A5|nr:amidohydrolase family protein [Aquamicrobium sp. LC103]TKT75790.1 amidohydrolase [Aquamicrobium sp. LC103]